MLTARYGTRLATPSNRARDLFETATYQILAHQPGVDARLAEAAAADPSCAGVRALRGLCQVLLARDATVDRARHDLNAALAACELAPASEDESALVEALQVAVHGGLRRAAGILEARIEQNRGWSCLRNLPTRCASWAATSKGSRSASSAFCSIFPRRGGTRVPARLPRLRRGRERRVCAWGSAGPRSAAPTAGRRVGDARAHPYSRDDRPLRGRPAFHRSAATRLAKLQQFCSPHELARGPVPP